jgi:hypothetical protein
VGFFIHAATVDTSPLGPRRSMTMPGVSATVGEEIEALRKAAGDKAVALIKRVDDPFVAQIVKGQQNAGKGSEITPRDMEAFSRAVLSLPVQDRAGERHESHGSISPARGGGMAREERLYRLPDQTSANLRHPLADRGHERTIPGDE